MEFFKGAAEAAPVNTDVKPDVLVLTLKNPKSQYSVLNRTAPNRYSSNISWIRKLSQLQSEV
ncbi:hypothetical protein AB1K32_28080 [Metabacillus dongyingensis]|uniref:hypothetical protein n=1 Tax=Metabacillus dongyingensis TaxID=2874282 RepID=UPI003B8BBF11